MKFKLYDAELSSALQAFKPESPTYQPSLLGRVQALKEFIPAAGMCLFGLVALFIGTFNTLFGGSGEE